MTGLRVSYDNRPWAEGSWRLFVFPPASTLISDPERECEVTSPAPEPAAAPHGEQGVGCRVGVGWDLVGSPCENGVWRTQGPSWEESLGSPHLPSSVLLHPLYSYSF